MNVTPPTPPGSQGPPSPPTPQSGRNHTSPWLWVGLALVVVAVIAAIILYFLQRRSAKDYDYSDGENPEIEQNIIPAEEASVKLPSSKEPVVSPLGNTAYFTGKVGTHLATMDINIDPDGNVTGVYWNVLYDIRLPISGVSSSSGVLKLSLGSGSERSELIMRPLGGGRYEGVWGKSDKPVTGLFCKGSRPVDDIDLSDRGIRLKVQGGGISPTAVMTDSYFRYDNQGLGEGHILRVEQEDAGQYTLHGPDGSKLASIYLASTPEGMRGSMTDSSGRTFDLIEL